MISERMRSAAGYGGDAGDRQSLLSAGADTIDALVAALDKAQHDICEMFCAHQNGAHCRACEDTGAALALARKGE